MRGWIAGNFKVEHLHGPERIVYGDDELVVLCLVRDGEPWMRSFVEHYFSLGARHLIFLDNGSTDGTVSAASEHDGVTVLRTKMPFDADLAGARGQDVMRRYLIERFGKGRWSLYVDIDELFDYPYSDVIGLGSFLRYLNSNSYTAVRAQMLDMFPERPLLEPTDEPDEPLKEVHRFYDISRLERRSRRKGYNVLGSAEIEWFKGGLRRTVFELPGPLLTKHPLVYSDGVLEPHPPHGVRNARIADVSCVLFHYKFLKHFREQILRAVEEGQYHHNSFAYKRYLEAIERNPELRLKRESATEISSVNDLLENRFLVVSEDYVDWVDAEEERRFSKTKPGVEAADLAGALLESRRRERAKTLKLGRLEHTKTEMTRRMSELEQELADGAREKQELERRAQKSDRRLQRCKRRARRLAERNGVLELQLENVVGSWGWRLEQRLRHYAARLGSLRRG
ncbi:MAG: glycosyltransferase family 2 protein [Actinomycetota bacterium]|nr:glycosyltransferase family 2 protein [Actinomycetota bacterium]